MTTKYQLACSLYLEGLADRQVTYAHLRAASLTHEDAEMELEALDERRKDKALAEVFEEWRKRA